MQNFFNILASPVCVLVSKLMISSFSIIIIIITLVMIVNLKLLTNIEIMNNLILNTEYYFLVLNLLYINNDTVIILAIAIPVYMVL